MYMTIEDMFCMAASTLVAPPSSIPGLPGVLGNPARKQSL